MPLTEAQKQVFLKLGLPTEGVEAGGTVPTPRGQARQPQSLLEQTLLGESPLLPLAGGIAGGVLGGLVTGPTVAGIPAGVGGGAVGGTALGTAIREAFNKVFGVRGEEEAGEAVKRVAGETALTAVSLPVGGAITRGIAKVLSPFAGAIKGLVGGKLDFAAKTYAASFPLPRQIAEQLKPVETFKKFFKYEFRPSTPEQLRNIASSITGENGILNREVRRIAGAIKTHLDPELARTGAKNTLEKSGLPQEVIDNALRAIDRNVFAGAAAGRRPGLVPGESLFEAAQNLQKLGFQHFVASERFGAANALQDSILGKVFSGSADDLMVILQKAADKEGISKISKNALVALKAISPKLAQEAVTNPRFAALRSLQSPFVNISRMLEHAETAAQGGLALGGAQAISGVGLPIVTQLVTGNPFLALGAFALSPAVATAIQATRFPILSLTARVIEKAGAVGAKAGNIGRLFSNDLARISAQITAGRTAVGGVLGGVLGGEQVPTPTPAEEGVLPSVLAAQAAQAEQPILSPQGQWRWDTQRNDWVPNTPESQGGFTREAALALMMTDLATTGGKNIQKIQTLYEFANPAVNKKSSALTTKVAGLKTARQTVDELSSLLDQVGLVRAGAFPAVLGPAAKAAGWWKSLLGELNIDANTRAYNDLRSAWGITLSKAMGQTGNLAVQEIQWAIGQIPRVTDSFEVAKIKLDGIRNLLEESRKNLESEGGGLEEPVTPSSLQQLLEQQGGF